MKLFKEEVEFLERQQQLISKVECLLDQLLTSTYEDHRYGRGFWSFYPERALNLMMTMKYAGQLELNGNENESVTN